MSKSLLFSTCVLSLAIQLHAQVGINTATPKQMLHVAGQARIDTVLDGNSATDSILVIDSLGDIYKVSAGDIVVAGADSGNFLIDDILRNSFSRGGGNNSMTGGSNFALGHEALSNNIGGASNTAIGVVSLKENTSGTAQVAIGNSALTANTTGTRNTAVGQGTLQTNTTGSFNSALGRRALRNNDSGSYNVVIGYQAAQNLVGGDNNLAIGANVTLNDPQGDNQLNIADAIYGTIYQGAGQDSIYIDGNLSIATQLRLNSVQTGNASIDSVLLIDSLGDVYKVSAGDIVVAGADSGNIIIDSVLNNLFSKNAGNTTTNAENNLALGDSALSKVTTGINNVAIGVNTLKENQDGSSNIAIGVNTLQINTSGFANSAIGGNALNSNTSGGRNMAIGKSALYSNTTGSSNVSIGNASLFHVDSGSRNIAIGDGAGKNLIDGDSNIFIGYKTYPRETSDFHYLNIGNTIYGLMDSNSIGIGVVTPQQTLHIGGQVRIDSVYTGNASIDSVLLIDSLGDVYKVSAGDIVVAGADSGNFLIDADNNVYTKNSLNEASPGSYNVAIGTDVLSTNTSGNLNTGIGASALNNNTTGERNLALGAIVLSNNTTGNLNSAIGQKAMQFNTTGNKNVAIGNKALRENTIGHQNLAVGNEALINNDSGSSNIGLGDSAGYNLVSGDNNLAIGANVTLNDPQGDNQLNIADAIYGTIYQGAGQDSIYIDGNLTIATQLRLNSVQTGNASIDSVLLIDSLGDVYKVSAGDIVVAGVDSGNFLIDDALSNLFTKNALNDTTTGYGNTALGINALESNSSGFLNMAIGSFTLAKNTTGERNTAIGNQPLQNNTTGNSNLAIGSKALAENITGSENMSIGTNALKNNTDGSYNTAIGTSAGSSLTSGDSNIVIGYNVQLTDSNSTQLNIGDAIYGKIYQGVGEDSIYIDGALSVVGAAKFADSVVIDHNLYVTGSVYNVGGIGSWTIASDKRLKKDIQSFNDGLEKLTQIKTVKYKYNGKGGTSDNNKEMIGVLAQDIQKIAPYMVEPFNAKLNSTDTKTTELLRYNASALTYILVNAVQELAAKNEALELKAAKVDVLENDLNAIKEQLNQLMGQVQHK